MALSVEDLHALMAVDATKVSRSALRLLWQRNGVNEGLAVAV